MKFKNILILAFKNILHKKSAYVKAFVSFFLVFLFANLLIFYSNSLSKTYTDYEIKNINWARYIIDVELSEQQELDIKKFNQVSSIVYESDFELDFKEDISFVINGNEYQIEAGKYFNAYLISDKSDHSIPENMSKAYGASGINLITYGKDITNKDDILLSEKSLSLLNIDASDELIGKSIALTNGEFSISGQICGILNGEVYSTTLFIGCLDSSVPYNRVDISLKSFLGNNDFFNKMDEMFGEEDNHYFLGNNEIEKMQLILGQQTLCSKFLSLICVIIVIVSFAYVTCNQFYLLQKNSTYYGVLKANGVSNGGIFSIHLFELIMLCTTALIIAFIASIGIFLALQKVFTEVFYIELIFSVGIAIGYLFALIALGILFSFLITLFIYKKLLSKPTIYLLKN